MDTHPYFKDDERFKLVVKELKSSAASISTADTAVESLEPHNNSFQPGRSFLIYANGYATIRLPTPPSQLEIPIYHPDGSLAYVSTREKKSSGNAILSCPKIGDLISTSYFFGPSRDPIIRLLQSPSEVPPEIRVSGKWTSRQQTFAAPNGSEFVWRYVREPEGKLLVLEIKDNQRRIAQLVRNEHRGPARRCGRSTGKGGELVLAQGAESELDEALIVATCLLMLKKEIDRMRAIQMCQISVIIGVI